MTSNKSGAASKADAIELLLDDHKKVKKLFKEFEKVKEGDAEAKIALVQQACMELKIHAMVEEEIFYPAVRDAIDEDDLMNEAEVEHDSAKDLISQIEGMESEDPMYDAKFTVLGEYVNHHVEEEEKEMFVKVKKAKLDLEALGEEMLARKEILMTEMQEDAAELAGQPVAKPASKKKSKQAV